MLKPLCGKRLPLKIRKDATHKEILGSGLNKWEVFNKAMIEDDENYMLLYDDGSEALFMPGQTQDFFVLSKYSDTFCSHFAAHFVREGQRDEHRPNRKRLRAILLLSGQRLGNSVRICIEKHIFPATPSSSSSETQGWLAGARGNKSDKEMKRRWFTSKADFLRGCIFL